MSRSAATVDPDPDGDACDAQGCADADPDRLTGIDPHTTGVRKVLCPDHLADYLKEIDP